MQRFIDPSENVLPESLDVAVVGGGLGGLIAALELSRQGQRVGVFEKKQIYGGYASFFRREGYHFDISLHHIGGLAPGCLVHGYLTSLGVFKRLNCQPCRTLFSAEYPGFSITLPADHDGIVRTLSERFPAEVDGINRLFTLIAALKSDVVAPTVNAEWNAAGVEHLSRAWAEKTYDALLRSCVSDEQLISVLSQMWIYIGLPPNLAAANFSACVNATAFVEGTWNIIGGGAALVRAIVDEIRENGGDCYAGTEVSRIDVEDGKTVGITLFDGRSIKAPIVVSGANPIHTFFDLVPSGKVSDVYRYRLKQMTPSLSMYAMYLGLDCPPSKLGIPDGSFFYNHQFGCEESYVNIMEHNIDRTDYCVDNSGINGTSVFPTGRGIVAFLELTPARDWFNLDHNTYRERKLAVRDALLTKYETRFPGLSSHIIVREFATPRTFTRLTGNHMGAVYGFAQLLEHSGNRRLRNRTPVSGLFLCGAWTGSGGGYEGAIASGLHTASVVMETQSLPYRTSRVRLHPDEASSPVQSAGSSGQTRPLVPIDERVPLETHYRFAFPVAVYGDELNSRGYADASAYLRYMDRARMEAIEEICSRNGDESWLSQYMVQIYRIEVRCATVIRLSDRLEVRTGIRRISTHRASFDQRIVNVKTGFVVVDSSVEVLFLNQQKLLVPVPDGLVSTDDAAPDFSFDRTEPVPFRDEDHFPFRAQYRVYFEDTDLQAVMFHVSYVRFCERALFDLIRAVWPDMQPTEWMKRNRSNVARVDIRYLHAARLGDYLEIRTGPIGFTTHKITFGQRIVNVRTGEILADAITDVDFRDENEAVVPIPKHVADIVRANLDVRR